MANKKQQKGVTFYCFSPLAMIVTFTLEIILAIYVLWRYKMSTVVRLTVAILVFLAVFQIAEYMVCRSTSTSGLVWSRIGYVAITLLPPLGLHLTIVLARATKHWLRWLLLPAYAMAIGFMLFFWLADSALTGHQCLGNYVIFQLADNRGWLYGPYYYGWILASLAIGLHYLHSSRDKHLRRVMASLVTSYVAFLLPTATVNLLSPQTLNGIPSIMCGFAVILAIMLVFVVLPSALSKSYRR